MSFFLLEAIGPPLPGAVCAACGNPQVLWKVEVPYERRDELCLPCWRWAYSRTLERLPPGVGLMAPRGPARELFRLLGGYA